MIHAIKVKSNRVDLYDGDQYIGMLSGLDISDDQRIKFRGGYCSLWKDSLEFVDNSKEVPK